MTVYYPGSKMRQKVYDANYEVPVPKEDVELGEGRDLSYKGQTVTFYPMGSLAIALNRQPVTLRKWEAQGIIPKATFMIGGPDKRAKRRLYTKDQLLGLRKVAWEEGILFPNGNGKYKAVESTNFREKAYKLFQELENGS